jgi:hypothetical protein
MKEQKILLIFKDGIVNFDDVADLWFFIIGNRTACQVTLKNGKRYHRYLFNLGDNSLVLPVISSAVVQIAMFADSQGNVSAEKYFG